MAHHRSMEPTDDVFTAELHAWLDDPEAPTFPEPEGGALAPSLGSKATERAIAEAATHETCDPDRRDFNMLIQVEDRAGALSVHSLAPEQTLVCILGILNRDDDVRSFAVIGIDGATYHPDEPEAPAANDPVNQAQASLYMHEGDPEAEDPEAPAA